MLVWRHRLEIRNDDTLRPLDPIRVAGEHRDPHLPQSSIEDCENRDPELVFDAPRRDDESLLDLSSSIDRQIFHELAKRPCWQLLELRRNDTSVVRAPELCNEPVPRSPRAHACELTTPWRSRQRHETATWSWNCPASVDLRAVQRSGSAGKRVVARAIGSWPGRGGGGVRSTARAEELEAPACARVDVSTFLCYPSSMPRLVRTEKVSVSLQKEDLTVLRQRAKRLYGGNLSALLSDFAKLARYEDGADRLIEWLTERYVPSAEALHAVEAEWRSPLPAPPKRGRTSRRKST